jgi:hypothetical protein
MSCHWFGAKLGSETVLWGRRASSGGRPTMSKDAVLASFVAATFVCAHCGRDAATVSVRPRGVGDPGLAQAPFGIDYDRVVVEAGTLSTSTGGTNVDAVLPAVLVAVVTGDPAALFAADFEMAPFWCPRCQASYCAEEWSRWPVYADDYPGWFEELRGRCPAGHERMLRD